MKSNRRSFLSGLAVASLAPAAAAAATPSPAPAAKPPAPERPKPFPFTFDRARYDKATASNARHRHMVAAATINYGRVFDVMGTIYDSYVSDTGAAKDSVLVAGVLYHGASVTLALNDTAWNDYVKPAMFGLDDDGVRDDLATAMPSKGGNPFASDLAGVAKYRTPLFVCRWAFGGMVHGIAKVIGKPAPETYAALSAALVPNAMLVPSGVWAIADVQSRGFTYQQATL